MYIPTKPTSLTATVNPVLWLGNHIRTMPRQVKIVFLLKYIRYSLSNRDIEAAKDGLFQLCMMIPELKNDLRIANRTYQGDDEGKRIATLFMCAYGMVKNAGKPNLWTGKNRRRYTKPLFS